MRNIFIIHGSFGNPRENWFPWLKGKLEEAGNRVFVPQFQIPKEQNAAWGGHKLEDWFSVLDEHKQYFNDETIFVAHSRGCIFLYHYLAQLAEPVSAVFLVAPWIDYRWYPEGWTEVDSFHLVPFDWKSIKSGSRYFKVYQSTNDDTPVSEGRKIAGKLGADLEVVKNAGHFNTQAGYTKFPLLLQDIRNVVGS